jgi:hypothetical protein
MSYGDGPIAFAAEIVVPIFDDLRTGPPSMWRFLPVQSAFRQASLRWGLTCQLGPPTGAAEVDREAVKYTT